MTPNQKREEISKAYVRAIAARCGFKIGDWSQDDDCVDVTIGASGLLGGGTIAGPKIDVQLKSSSAGDHAREDHIAWSLKRKHYDRLRQDSSVPLLLVVLLLPEDEDEWVTHSAAELIMRRCAYWMNLHGMPPITGAADSTTVRIPIDNLFGPDALMSMMTRVSQGLTP